ncbi:hypothetical protein ACWDSJ_14285 [Nocardia sp. NPDC003482]
MRKRISQKVAEIRAARKFQQLYVPLMELIDRLQDLEPGGTLVDDIIIDRDKQGHVHIEYTAHPISLVIKDKDKALILRVLDADDFQPRTRTKSGDQGKVIGFRHEPHPNV